MFKLKSSNNIYEESARAVSSAESDARYLQIKIDSNTSLLADLRGEKGEKIACLRSCAMWLNMEYESYDGYGRMTYLTADDLRREAESKIYRLEKKLSSAKGVLAERQAELERVQFLLAEDEAHICAPVVEEEDDDLDF